MVHSSVVAVLERGRGTRGLTEKVAGIVQKEPTLFPELMFGLWHVDGPIRSLAADAVERATRESAKGLQAFKTEILGLMQEARPAKVRWNLAMLLPRLKLNRVERERAVGLLREYLEDRSSIVKTLALDSLDQMAEGDADLREEVDEMLRVFSRTGTPAMRARARILMAKAVKKAKAAGKK